MFFSHDSEEARAHAVLEGKHDVPLSHELIAGAASYEAAKTYGEFRKREGKPIGHERAVELLAAATGVYIDRFAETKGAQEFNKDLLKRDASRRAEDALVQSGQY